MPPLLSPEVKQAIAESVLCWLATVDGQGRPNVSPKEMFLSGEDDRLLIGNIASPKSVENIRQNSHVCVSFVNVFKQSGYKLTGCARILEPGDNHYRPHMPVVEVRVELVERLLAPSYHLAPDMSETERVTRTMATYGVKPR